MWMYKFISEILIVVEDIVKINKVDMLKTGKHF